MSYVLRQPRFLPVVLLLILAASTRAAAPFNSAFISECLLENAAALKDEDGDHPPWIELHNGGTTSVALQGWFLTDNAAQPRQWPLPGVVLLPQKYLVVFASGKGRTNPSSPLHASFRLKPDSRFLALVNSAGEMVSQFAPGAAAVDVSQGRVQGEPALTGHFPRPTPGKPNGGAGRGFAPAVTFSVPPGNFSEPFTVNLEASGASIRYTLDGSLPTSAAPLYRDPLLITNTVQVRARAYQDGILPGPPQSAAYLRLASNVMDFHSNLPLLVLDTFEPKIHISGQETTVHLSVHEPENGRASLTNAPATTSRAMVRVRGSTSAGMPQPGLALECVDEFNQERALPLAGLPPDSDWVLYAPNAYDPVLIHNPFVHQLSRDMGRYSPRTRFVEVFVAESAGRVRKNHYRGLYVLMEKISIGRHRVDIHRLDANDVQPPAVTGGFILKFDRLGPGEAGFSASNGRGLAYVEPKEQTLLLPQRAPQRQYLQRYLADFIGALHGPQFQDPARGYRAFLDVEAAIDFHVLEVLSGNVDAMVLSTYFHKPRQGRIVCGPHWDFDRALGSIDERDANPRQWNTGPFFGGEWWPRLFSDVDFWQLWVDRWEALRETHFSQTNLHALIDRLTGELRQAQPRQYQRWGLQARGGTYEAEIQHMKDWLSNRLDFIDGQLTPPPVMTGATHAASLVFSGAAKASIYYTLDGSDPRRAQGGIAPGALLYTNPIPMQANTRVMARAHDPTRRQEGGPPVSTPWSRPVEFKKR